MGITFKAFDTNLRFPVALKVINAAYLDSDTARQRFLREARAAAAMRHPNVASVFNLGTEEERYFYVMELIDGETVETRVRRHGPLGPVEALNIGLQVTRALVAAAKQQLVHRDLKPSNLMLVNHEGEQIVKVTDFGLAKVSKDAGEDSGALTIGGFVGTPHFASPEQIEEGEVDIRSDIYSLGVTLYFILTGQSPYSGSAGQVISQQLYKPLPIEPLAKLPGCVVSLVQQMVQKDPNQRPQTPQDLQKAILACIEELRHQSFSGTSPSGEATTAFELLGGPRSRLESTGQYTPVAALTQDGNAALRRALADECPSAEELAKQLAAATSIGTSTPGVSDNAKQAVQTPASQIPLPQDQVAIPDPRKPPARRWRWIVILCLIVFVAIGFSLLGLLPRIEEIPLLTIHTDPDNIAIFLDGEPPDTISNTFSHVRFGTHELRAVLSNREIVTRKIQIQKGSGPEMRLELAESLELPSLSIRTEPAGASILLDGLSPQSPPDTFTHVHFGSHQVIATLDKYQPIRKNIDVRQGMTGRINIELRQNPPDDIEWMRSLDTHRLEEARKEFAEALEIYRELADKNPGTYLPEVAKALNNLAILDGQQSHREQARQEFAEALQVYRELAGTNQEMDSPLVATALNNLANVDSDFGRFDDARKEFMEALEIRHRLAQKNPDIYEPLIAKALNNLGVLDRRQNRIEEARNEFEEALKIYRLELTQKNPEVYLPYAAMTLINLAIIESHLNRWEDARKGFAEALEFYRKLAEKKEATYQPLIATTLNYLGYVDLHEGRKEEARKEFAEALQIYESLESQDPEQFTPRATHLRQELDELSRRR
jgi:serine/threonine protein kinase/tetratricopeptide (TPR) repeat protein